MNVTQILQSHARECPDRVALIDRLRGRPRRMTFGELELAAGRLARMLREAGLRPGDAVLVFHPMSCELYTALAGILRLGLVAMFVDPSAGRRYIDRCCDLLQPRGFIASPKAHALRLLSPRLRDIPVKVSVGARLPGAIPFAAAQRQTYDGACHPCELDTPALLSFTSGSTAEPKAALRTHGFLLAQHQTLAENLSLLPGEVELVTLPIFVLANLASRVTSVIADCDLRRLDRIDPAAVLDQLDQHEVTRIAAAPTFYDRLASACETQRRTLPRLRKVFTGGGPVSPRLLKRLQQVAPNVRIVIVYGSTEAEPISTMRMDQMSDADFAAMSDGRGLLVGHPVSSLQVCVLPDRWGDAVGAYEQQEFDALRLGPGEPGEIVVAGDHILPGYLFGVGDDVHKFDVGGTRWHRTGDAGYFDEQHRLWLLGRCAARVTDQRGTLYPLGVEHAAMQHPAIHRAAIVRHRGQRILTVQLRHRSAELDFGSLMKSLSFANVDQVHILRHIPVDARHNAKVDYPALSALLEKHA